eukprot:667287-Pleurochrysis_carterae.AAC.1
MACRKSSDAAGERGRWKETVAGNASACSVLRVKLIKGKPSACSSCTSINVTAVMKSTRLPARALARNNATALECACVRACVRAYTPSCLRAYVRSYARARALRARVFSCKFVCACACARAHHPRFGASSAAVAARWSATASLHSVTVVCTSLERLRLSSSRYVFRSSVWMKGSRRQERAFGGWAPWAQKTWMRTRARAWNNSKT